MRHERFSQSSAAEYDYEKSARKRDDDYSLKSFGLNKYLNRPLASLIVRAVLKTAVTPNQISLASFFFSLAGAYCFFKSRPLFFALGGILAQVSSIVDCADGMLARARDQKSEYGAYLDLVLDRVGEFFLMMGYTLGYYLYAGRLDLLIIGFITVALYFLQICLYYLIKSYRRDSDKGNAGENRSWLIFLMFILSVFNRMDLGFYILFIVSSGVNLFLLFDFLRRKDA
jgi:phosphatidylglycerophosphate synthase